MQGFAIPEYSPHEIRIIRGTYKAMATIGTQQLSLRRIAKELAVSPALIGYHFKSRDALVMETMRWALAGTVRRISKKVANAKDARAAFSALMDGVFLGAKPSRDFHLIYLDLVQYSTRESTFVELADLLRTHIDGTYASVIRQGAEAGLFQVDDLAGAAKRARAVVEGSFIQWLQDKNWEQSYGALREDCETALLKLFQPLGG
ncbi:TetR/AcrR family transcriptional regulator (plasmid) [Agrobacterium fabrum]|nr:TetR/AcrR family transcriptional regulator [Agrobacterium fabrum]WCK80166.1 TetR/AcrR family transcriptional regulator [Agrobacterium fabrum]